MGLLLTLMSFALELEETDGAAGWNPSAVSPGAGTIASGQFLPLVTAPFAVLSPHLVTPLLLVFVVFVML